MQQAVSVSRLGRSPYLFHLKLLSLTLLLILTPQASGQLTNEDVARIFQKEDQQQLTQDRLSKARGLVEAEAKKRRPGVVYKNPRFWSTLRGFEPGRDVFEGNFQSVNLGTLRQFYLDYFARRSADCRTVVTSSVHVEFPEYSRTVWKRDDGTIESATGWTKSGAVFVEARYSRKYREYLEQPNLQRELRVTAGIFTTLLTGDPNGISALPQIALEILQTQAAIRRFNSLGCSSPATQQMMENLHRLATNIPSLQSAGLMIPNAELNSDSLPEPAEYIALEDACTDHYLGRNSEWCTCLGPRLRTALPVDTYLGYVSDFNKLVQILGRDRSRERDIIQACIR